MIDLYNMVMKFREMYSDYWKSGDRFWYLMFALQEIAEVSDAITRLSPEWARANDRVVDINTELADTAIMLLSAMDNTRSLPPMLQHFNGYLEKDKYNAVRMIALHVATALYNEDKPRQNVNVSIREALMILSQCCDLQAQVPAKLTKIMKKFVPEIMWCDVNSIAYMPKAEEK